MQFVNKAFKVKTVKDKKTGEVSYFNEGIRKDTPEGKFALEFQKLMNYVPDTFKQIAEITFGEAKAENIIKDNNIKWIGQTKKGFYIPQRLTKEFGEFYEPSHPAAIEAIKKLALENSYKLAKEKYKTKFDKADKIKKAEMVNEFIENQTDIAKLTLHQSSVLDIKNLN